MRWFCSFFGILFYLLLLEKGFAQQIEFRCTQVNASGDITLTWTQTGLPANYQYEIYRSLSKTGTYTLVTTITVLATTTYTDLVGDGGGKQYFYVIKAVALPPAPGTEYVSDTIGNIAFLNLTNTRGVAGIYFTHPSDPPLPSQAQEFHIYRQRNSTWDLWAKTPLLEYFDTTHVCGENLGYEIRLYDSSGCESISIIRTESFTDGIEPSTPQLDSVSVNPVTGKTELGWNRSPDEDVVGYIIYIFRNNVWEILDTLMGADSTYYIDYNNDANNGSQQYRIAAIDTCRNPSPIGSLHNTLFVNSTTGLCDSISLSWNAYVNMPNGLTGYRIWVSINGSPFFLLDTVSGNSLSYIHLGVNPLDIFTYYIQAYNLNNGYSSTSPGIEVRFGYVASSGDVCLRYASVVDNEYIEIAVFVPDTVKFNWIFLFKSENKTSFTQINSQSKISGNENYLFEDKDVDVMQQTYHYMVSLMDVCNNVFAFSDTANNIVLSSKDAPTVDEIAIQWEPYYGFDLRLDSYDVLRRTQVETLFQVIDNIPDFQLNYSENVWNMASQGGKLYYQVCAIEGTGNIYGFEDKSYSNVVEITKEPMSYIPNIFCPNSDIEANRIFKPVHSYVDAEEYAFSIFDRWGSLVFRTHDITAGWDGTTDGKIAMAGVYTYTITYRIDEKNIFNKQGRVTLVR
jgi:gliding motility-associated-like protein